MTITIAQLPTELIQPSWPWIGPYLLEGARVAEDIEQGIQDIAANKARVWVILDEDEVLGAFLTSVVEDKRGTAVDVYGLGGRHILRWGKKLSDEMVAYAKQNDCGRVIFKGRKALMRAYEGIRPVGQEEDGTMIYERAVA